VSEPSADSRAAVSPGAGGPRSLLEPRHWRLLLLLGFASFFEGYDFNIVTVALKPIRTTFHLSQGEAALWISIIYLGAVPAVVAARRADRHGRRTMLLFAIAGYTLATAATALAPDLQAFVVAQFVARFFLVLEAALVWTVVAEELPAGARGFGFGWLAMLSALGTGWAAILNGTVVHPLHQSWRLLYVLALPVLVFVAMLWRSLEETGRYRATASHGALAREWRDILRPPYRSRLALLCAVAFLGNLTTQATAFVVDFMQTQRHLSATAASLTLVASGALAIPVLVVAGSVSDRVGRKPVLCSFLGLHLVGLFVFFQLARGQLALFVALALVYAGLFGAWPTGTGYGAELFPTALRALGNSTGAGSKYLGQSMSFVAAGVLLAGTAGLGRVVMLLSVGPLLSGLMLLAWMPETGGRELESISPPIPGEVEVALVSPELP
jgi:putative MFS transporter